jgi:hypothetical protein
MIQLALASIPLSIPQQNIGTTEIVSIVVGLCCCVLVLAGIAGGIVFAMRRGRAKSPAAPPISESEAKAPPPVAAPEPAPAAPPAAPPVDAPPMPPVAVEPPAPASAPAQAEVPPAPPRDPNATIVANFRMPRPSDPFDLSAEDEPPAREQPEPPAAPPPPPEAPRDTPTIVSSPPPEPDEPKP